MPKPHKHAKLIKAWADGAEIQVCDYSSESVSWINVKSPQWREDFAYRIKPEPKPDLIVHSIVEFRHLWKTPYIHVSWQGDICPEGYKHNVLRPNVEHLRYIFDGETSKLKSVEIINESL